jgi:hypothetical protein
MTPKTEAEMSDEQRIEKAAKKYSTYDGDLEDDLDFKAHDMYVGFKAGIAWRDANPKEHPDSVRLQWMIENEKKLVQFRDGRYLVSGELPIERCFFKDPREAIDACIAQEKKEP